MPKITKQNFLQNRFSRSNTTKIIKILNNILDSSTTKSQLISLLNEQTQQFLWAVGSNPAYHIQYQIDSVAIIKVNNFYVIVWKPKFIQYPQMIKFPQIKDIKSISIYYQIKLNQNQIKALNYKSIKKQQIYHKETEQKLLIFYKISMPHISDQMRIFKQYLIKFIKIINLQNLVTYTKHFITKKTTVNYWHCLYDDEDSLLVKNIQKMTCVVKIKVSGIKKGYNKCLLLFSCKGQRQGVFHTITKKWMETISFLAMVMIFVSIVSCDSGATQGICQYRDDAMIVGAGIMMSLFGLKLAKRSQKKKNNKKAKQN